MEQLSYSTAGQTGPTPVYAPPYVSTSPQSLGPSSSGGLPPPPTHSATVAGMLPYGVEIPNRVFVGGCPFSMTDKQLGEVFVRYGTVKDSKIIADRSTGKSKGYGFVTFSSEEEAANVHAMGSIFYNEKKLNLARAIRKCGGQFNRANQEYINGQRAVWMHPSGYLIQQFEGNWHFEQFSPHSQPVKPCYPAMYYPPPPSINHQPYYVNSGGYSPVGTGAIFPPNQPYTGVNMTNHLLTTYNNSEEDSKDKRGEKEDLEEVPSKSSLLIVEKKEESSDQLADKVQQLSLDSAYTSEADLEQSTAPSSPQEEAISETEECLNSVAEKKVAEEPPDIGRIVKIRKSPHSLRRSHIMPAHTGSNALKYTGVVSSPPRLYTNGHYFNPMAAAFTPGHYVMPMTPSPPYTPHAAVQTIGPVYQ